MKTIPTPQLQYGLAVASAEGVVERYKATATSHVAYATYLSQLEALKPEERTIETIDKIIGHPSWTTPWCGVCMEYRSPVAVFGSDFQQHVCIGCLTHVLRALRKLDAIETMKTPRIAP